MPEGQDGFTGWGSYSQKLRWKALHTCFCVSELGSNASYGKLGVFRKTVRSEHFSSVPNKIKWKNHHKLWLGRFMLESRKQLHAMQVVQHSDRTPEWGVSPPLEVFEPCHNHN